MNYSHNFEMLNSSEYLSDSSLSFKENDTMSSYDTDFSQSGSNENPLVLNFIVLNEINNILNEPSKNCEENLDDLAKIVANTIYAEKYLNTDDAENLLLYSLLKDKAFELYNQYFKLDEKSLEYAREMHKHWSMDKNIRFPGCNESAETIWNIYLSSFSIYSKSLCEYSKKLPGFNRICLEDFSKIVSESFYFLYPIHHSELVIDGESFVYFSGVQFSKKCLGKYLSSENIDKLFYFYKVFNELRLSKREISLITPFMLTSTSNTKLTDPSIVKSINQYYYKALLFEFNLNRRDDIFVKTFEQVLEYLEKIVNEIYL